MLSARDLIRVFIALVSPRMFHKIVSVLVDMIRMVAGARKTPPESSFFFSASIRKSE